MNKKVDSIQKDNNEIDRDARGRIIDKLKSLLVYCARHPDVTIPCIMKGCESTCKDWDYNIWKNRVIKAAIVLIRKDMRSKIVELENESKI